MWENAEDKRLYYFEIHVHTNRVEADAPLALLYVQLSDSTSAIKIPPFLKIREEVTDQPEFSSNHIALLAKP